ncbi:biotin-dependent carboxyltransferase family protein [Blastochloris tepida]|uniref:Allophanate hydrolase n=1 Tax=Blastochloris tepida TaxID=2233851 RepID=A0A348FX53_9HYPH|nr:biotin-dependent carboxyltransferase family protein [Blastochloris tepida]BBF91886.1 allophanate hydrolase [Blastochloris tepida]
MSALLVHRPGLATTVQDRGRFGLQRFGVPASGALDPESYTLANALAGNPPGAAALEIRLAGPALEVEAESAIVALVGGDTPLTIGGPAPRTVPPGRSVRVVAGDVIEVAALRGSSTAYLAVRGGIDVPAVLGSRSTFLRGPFGGLEGRALRAGDRVPLGALRAPDEPERALPAGTLPKRPDTLHVVLGPQADMFTQEAIETFLSAAYTVTHEADRMGIRLEGERLTHAGGFDIVSDGIAPGAIQVPGSGQPIVLLADRQTTGGYPKIATVISADIGAAGRLGPGDCVRFAALDVAAAEQRARAHHRALEATLARIAQATVGMIDEAALHSENLIHAGPFE